MLPSSLEGGGEAGSGLTLPISHYSAVEHQASQGDTHGRKETHSPVCLGADSGLFIVPKLIIIPPGHVRL